MINTKRPNGKGLLEVQGTVVFSSRLVTISVEGRIAKEAWFSFPQCIISGSDKILVVFTYTVTGSALAIFNIFMCISCVSVPMPTCDSTVSRLYGSML